MDRLLVRVFLQQALRQCDYALIAEEEIRTATDSIRRWYAIENFVTATAKLSRVFYGSRTKRRQLRQLVGLTHQSALSHPLEMRDALEHFDDRIIDWWNEAQQSGDVGIYDANAGTGLEPYMMSERWPLHRSYSFGKHVLTFGARTYSFKDLTAEIKRIRPMIETELEADDPMDLWTNPPRHGGAASSTSRDEASPS